jgi:hypothetical protein
MEHEKHPVQSVLLFSGGNPDATFLAAGLLHGRPADVGTVSIQGVGEATPTPEVRRILAEMGLDVRGWVPQVVDASPAEPVDVGLTICVPT